jgi:porphobilinogen deaminase
LKKRRISIGSIEGELQDAKNGILTGYLGEMRPDLDVVTISIRTTEKNESTEEAAVESENALEDALRSGLTDLTFRDLTEISYAIPDDLPIVAYARRGDPRDALILPKGRTNPDPSRPMATSTLMKAVQLRKLYPGFRFAIAKGTIPELVERVDGGHYSGIVLSSQDLILSGFEKRISRYFTELELMPDPGQGILAAQGRAEENYSYLAGFSDDRSACEAVSERVFADMVTRGRMAAASANAKIRGGQLILRGLCYDRKLKKLTGGEVSGPAEEAGALGAALAESLIAGSDSEENSDGEEERLSSHRV